MKKSLTIIIIMILIIGIYSGVVNAASASIKASSSSVTNGNTVTITVSFGQKVSVAQFDLNFDTSKLEYVSGSVSAGEFNKDRKKFGYAASSDNLSSVSFKFKTKATGQASVSVSNLQIGVGSQNKISASMANSSTKITVKAKSTTTTKPTTNKKPTTTTKEEPKKPEPAPNELIKLDNENVKTLKDIKTKIMVKGVEVAIEEGIVLEVKNIKKYEKEYKTLEEILKNISGTKTYFDINLLKDNVKVQPNGYVTVCIPIPEEYDKDSVKVYFLDKDKEKDEEKYELVEGEIQALEKQKTVKTQKEEIDEKDYYYTFTTNHFSLYALVGEIEEKEEEKEEVEIVAPVEPEPTIDEKEELIQRVIEFVKNPIFICVIIGLLFIIVII